MTDRNLEQVSLNELINIELAIEDYVSRKNNYDLPFVPELKRIKDLGRFVLNLSQEQLNGKKAMISTFDINPNAPLKMGLYWDYKNQTLQLEWDESYLKSETYSL